MKHTKRWLGVTAAMLAFALVAASCGDSGSNNADAPATTAPATTAAVTTTTGTATTEAPATTEAAPVFDGTYDLGGGAVLDTNECPGNWDSTQGITDTEITIGTSMPQSGALAGFGTIADGMQIYFDNADPIDGKSVKIVTRDDGYESGRTVTNVNEMIDSGEIFGFSDIIGSPNNLAVRDTLNEECIPQLFASTGLPEWGDPANFPFTSGGLIPYNTESLIWCNYLADVLGDGGTVAALYVNSDFGKSYQKTFEQCAPEVGLEIVATEVHDPNADTVQNEVTTLAASGAQAFIIGSSGANCPRGVAGAAAVGWETNVVVSATCQNIGLFWKPIGKFANGIHIINTSKDVSDPAWADDPFVQKTRSELTAAGIDPETGSYQTGYIFAQVLESVLLKAAASPEGLNRGSLVDAMWSMDVVLAALLPGARFHTDGSNDAYVTEAGFMSELEYDATADTASWAKISELIDQEGVLGHFGG